VKDIAFCAGALLVGTALALSPVWITLLSYFFGAK